MTTTPLSLEEVHELLKQPDALKTLELLGSQGWLQADPHEIEVLFSCEPDHPAKQLLVTPGIRNGNRARTQFLVLAGFLVTAQAASLLVGTLPPIVYAMWGALGITTGMLYARWKHTGSI